MPEEKIHIIQEDYEHIWCGGELHEVAIAVEWKIASELIDRKIADQHICPYCMFEMGKAFGEKYKKEKEDDPECTG
jgi:hypothetical protein